MGTHSLKLPKSIKTHNSISCIQLSIKRFNTYSRSVCGSSKQNGSEMGSNKVTSKSHVTTKWLLSILSDNWTGSQELISTFFCVYKMILNKVYSSYVTISAKSKFQISPKPGGQLQSTVCWNEPTGVRGETGTITLQLRCLPCDSSTYLDSKPVASMLQSLLDVRCLNKHGSLSL